MRKKCSPRCRLDLACVPRHICKELSGMSEWLDAHPESIDWVFAELDTGATFDTGRMGLSAESVLRTYPSPFKLLLCWLHLCPLGYSLTPVT